MKRQEIIRLHAAGVRGSEIARRVGVSRQHVSQIVGGSVQELRERQRIQRESRPKPEPTHEARHQKRIACSISCGRRAAIAAKGAA